MADDPRPGFFRRWHVRTQLIVFTAPLIVAMIGVAVWALHARDLANLQEKLTQRARSLSTQIMADRTYYTSVIVPRAAQLGGSFGEDYQQVHGRFPLPATFVREVSDITAVFQEGYTASLISPWPINKAKGLRDQFQKDAFAYLLNNPTGQFYRTDTMAGRAVLRFISADRATVQSCADCHNAHPNSPKHDFNLHDVIGGLEIIIPIDRYLQETRQNSLIVVVSGAGLGLLIIGTVAWGTRRTITRPLGKLAARLQRSLRADNAPSRPLPDSDNELAQFEQAYLDIQMALADKTKLLQKQQAQLQVATAQVDGRLEKRAQALLAAAERIHPAVDFTRDAILYLDDRGLILWATKATAQLTGQDLGKVIGQPLASWLSPESARQFQAQLHGQRMDTQPQPLPLTGTITQADGSLASATIEWAAIQEDAKAVGRLVVIRRLSRPASSTPG